MTKITATLPMTLFLASYALLVVPGPNVSSAQGQTWTEVSSPPAKTNTSTTKDALAKPDKPKPKADKATVKAEPPKTLEEQLQAKIEEHRKKSQSDEKQLPILIGQGDAALRAANEHQKEATNTKDPKAKLALQQKVAAEQNKANEHSYKALETRKDYYAQLQAISQLEKQLAQLNPQKKDAPDKDKDKPSKKGTRSHDQDIPR